MTSRFFYFCPMAIRFGCYIFNHVTRKHDGSGRRKDGDKDNLKVRGILTKGH